MAKTDWAVRLTGYGDPHWLHKDQEVMRVLGAVRVTSDPIRAKRFDTKGMARNCIERKLRRSDATPEELPTVEILKAEAEATAKVRDAAPKLLAELQAAREAFHLMGADRAPKFPHDPQLIERIDAVLTEAGAPWVADYDGGSDGR